MKLYGGIDLHSNNNVVHLVDENGALVLKKRLANDLAMMLALLQPYIDSIVGLVVESTYNWYWLVDGLVEAGHKSSAGQHSACTTPRLKSATSKNALMVAKKTIAHNLARACFYVLRDDVEFDLNKACRMTRQ